MKIKLQLILFVVVAALVSVPLFYVGAQGPPGGVPPAGQVTPPPFADQADHMLLPAADGVGYCGLAQHVEPWTLHIAAVAGSVDATLTIEFRDGDSITFKIPANTSFSLTEAFGGVPTVDDLLRITLSGSGANSVVSARARANAVDPFIEPGAAETDNLCVNLADEGPISTLLAVPNSWVVDGDGSNGGALK